MTKQELVQMEESLLSEYQRKLHDLRKSYVESSSRFKVGDFILSLTGIIRIDTVSYIVGDEVTITYCGLRYRLEGGLLVKDKRGEPVCIEDHDNLVLVDSKLD